MGLLLVVAVAACSRGASQPTQSEPVAPGGDVPDNAVFLTYIDAGQGFSIQYVEGWQVSPQAGGVTIHDKDSSETVLVVPLQPDVPAFVRDTDLPTLEGSAGYGFIGQDTVAVGDAEYIHVTYHALSPPDPVTAKRVSTTVDRYYVPGPNGLAIVTLSTPDGVDNVDAFRQMIESLAWT